MPTTDKDKSIILFFIENDNEPTHATAIAKKSGAISKKWAGDRCDHLEGSGVLSHKMVRPARQAHETEYYFLAPTIDALHAIVDAFNHDRDAQTAFMRSQYYQDMTLDLMERFKRSIPDNDLWKFTTYKHDATRDKPLSKEDEEGLTRELRDKWIRNNWIALKFVTHFVSADSDERSRILRQLIETVRNPHISPAAAGRREYHKGFCSGMDTCTPWIKERVVPITTINETVQLTYADARSQAEMGIYDYGLIPAPDELLINWMELFTQLHHFNSYYRFLFD